MNTSDLLRQRFVALQNEFGSIVTPEPSKIRIEVPLKEGVGQYRFDIKKIVDNLREQSLDRNDVFVPNYIGIMFGFQNPDKPQTMSLYPYAPVVGDGLVAQEGFVTKDANALYNGQLTLQIDNTMILNSYPTENFKKVPEEQGCVIYDGTELTNMGIQPEFTIKDACELVIPRILIAGTRDIKFMVNFDGAGLQFDATYGTGEDGVLTPVLVFYMDGFLLKNGCEKGIGVKDSVAPVVGNW